MASIIPLIAGLAVVCLCVPESADAFFIGAGRPVTCQGQVSRRSCGGGGLYMAKHRQNKATKKHVKERPRKTSLSDRNHKPPVYSIEVMTNGNFPGAPPVWELLEEPAEGIDTKASVIEKLASAKWDAEHPVEAAEAKAAAATMMTSAVTKLPPKIADEIKEAPADGVIGAAVEKAVAEAITGEVAGVVAGEGEEEVAITDDVADTVAEVVAKAVTEEVASVVAEAEANLEEEKAEVGEVEEGGQA